MRRRTFLDHLTAGSAAATLVALGPTATVAAATSASRKRRSKDGLVAPAFQPLPLGSIQADGWLRRQLRQQADGLTGHLDEFWPDVADSQWFGGKAEGWERAPYWLDGLVPLAWVLDDAPLKAKAERRVRQILASQRADGWYAPYPTDDSARNYDLWAILLVNKVLVQFHDATGEASVLQAVVRNLRALNQALDRTPLFGWGKFRWFEGLVAVYDVYERTGEAWLLDLGRKLADQGFDYGAFYGQPEVTSPTPRRGLWTWEKHVVNTAMALKAGVLAYRLTGADADRALPAEMLRVLDRYHGQVHGLFSGDECLSGRNPLQGTELCSVVEALYSLELAFAVTGESAYADRLERVAFNALPATFAPDMWSHQYDQQANQVQCTVNPEHMWSTNGPESNLFGLEPNFGCCTANLHQGWPKLAAHLWMRTPDPGLVVASYAPCRGRCELRGAPVDWEVVTDYPFRDSVRIRIGTPSPVRFPLMLRVPSWTQGATVQVSGGAVRPLEPGSLHRIAREWRGKTEVELRLPAVPAITRRYNRSVAIERGPLVYSLRLGESWTRIHADRPHRELPHGDFEVRATTPWNYGLLVDESDPAKSVTFEERPVGDRPFSADGAGIVAKVKGRRLPGWKLEHGWAGETPVSPVASGEPVEELTLVPYGCAKIRVTEFPVLKG